MKLTGKCKEDFTDYLLKANLTKYEYQGLAKGKMCESTFNTHILEFFDSVEIYCFPCINYQFGFEIYRGNDTEYIARGLDFASRKEATNKAIEKANEIYNN